MNKNKVDELDMVNQLKKILAALDRLGHTIPAIKIEEAIHILQASKQIKPDNDGSF